MSKIKFKSLEGQQVSVALCDGSRIDDCQLVSVGRRTGSLWLFSNGNDIFVPETDVTDLWAAA